MSRCLKVLCLASIVWIASCGDVQQQHAYSLLEATSFIERIEHAEDPLLVDVRTAKEFQQGHIQGAVNLDYYAQNFRQNLADLDHSKPIFIYCAQGGRSHKTAEIVLELGFQHVYELKGGFLSLKE